MAPHEFDAKAIKMINRMMSEGFVLQSISVTRRTVTIYLKHPKRERKCAITHTGEMDFV